MNDSNKMTIANNNITIPWFIGMILILLIGISVWLLVLKHITNSTQETKAKQYFSINAVREFVTDKTITNVNMPDKHSDNEAHDITITIENADGTEETKTFKDCPYGKTDSTDGKWHITIYDKNYVLIHEPPSYTSK